MLILKGEEKMKQPIPLCFYCNHRANFLRTERTDYVLINRLSCADSSEALTSCPDFTPSCLILVEKDKESFRGIGFVEAELEEEEVHEGKVLFWLPKEII
jgi:hypothetical protein